MKKKIIGIFICMLFLALVIPITEAQNDETINPSNTLLTKKATIFGRWEDIGVDETLFYLETISIWVISYKPFSIDHYGRGETLKIVRGSGYDGPAMVLPLFIFVTADIVI